MKKLALLCAAAAALLAINASASTTSDYSVLSISLTYTTNSTEMIHSNTSTMNLISHTLNTSDLLHLFEGKDFANKTFPAGSRLVVGWDTGGDVLVIDSSNNILYNANTNAAAFFRISFNSSVGLQSRNYDSSAPGHDDYVELTTGNFELYDDISTYTYLYGGGTGTFGLSQNWNANEVTTTYSHSESLNAVGLSSSYAINRIDGVDVKATITASGHGTGESVLY